jgi:PadR family transcriptional regulator AphA
VHTPVHHVRDLRSELLLKLVLAEANGIDIGDTIAAQRDRVAEVVAAFEPVSASLDVVELWRHESASAALRFLDRLA